MAETLASLRIEIDGSSANQQIKQITSSMQQMIDLSNKMAQAFKQVGDQASLQKAVDQATTAKAKFDELAKTAQSMAAQGGASATQWKLLADVMTQASAKTGAMTGEVAKLAIAGKDEATIGAMLNTQMGTYTKFVTDATAAVARETGATVQNAAAKREATTANTSKAGSETKVIVEQDKGTESAKRETVAVKELTAAHEKHGRMAQQVMIAERGWHDVLGQGFGGVGKMIRGVDDLALALQRGGESMVGMVVGMGALAVAMKAISVPIDLVKEGMSSAADEETMGIAIKDVVGNAKAAREELEQLKDFATGPLGDVFKFDDLVEGARKLQLLTGQAKITDDQLRMLAAAAEVNHQSFSHVAEQYGKVYNAIASGLPVRAQLLVQMKEEGLISADTVTKVENLVKKHADTKTVMAALNAGMQQNEATANELANSYTNLQTQLGKVFEMDVAAPIGKVFTDLLKEPMAAFTKMLLDHKKDIQDFADQLELSLLTAIYYIRDQGIEKALQEGWDSFNKYVEDTVLPFLEKKFFDWFKKEWDQTMEDARKAWEKLTGFTEMTPLQKAQLNLTNAQTSLAHISMQTGMSPEDRASRIAAAQQQVIDAEKQVAVALIATTDKTTQAALGFHSEIIAAALSFLTIMQTGLQGILQGLTGQQFGAAPFSMVPGQPGFVIPGKGMKLLTREEYDWEGISSQVGPLGNRLQTGPYVGLNPEEMRTLGVKIGDFVHTLEMGWVKIQESASRAGTIEFHADYAGQFQNRYPSLTIDQVRKMGVLAPITDLAKTSTAPETPVERAIREAKEEKAKLDAQLDQPGKGGAPGQIEPKAAKDTGQKDMLRAMNDLVKELDNSYSKYGKDVALIDDQVKNGQKDINAAIKEKLGLNEQEQATIQKGITALKEQEAAVKKAYPKADVDKYDESIKKLEEDMKILVQRHKELAGGDFWGSFTAGIQKTINSWGTFGEQVSSLSGSLTDDLKNGLGNAMTQLVEGTGKVGDAFKSMLDSMIQAIMNFLAQQAVQELFKVFGSIFSSAAGAGAGTISLGKLPLTVGGQMGGMVSGPGGIDNVPAMLTAGEYVISRNAAMAIGYNQLNAINNRFASGGLVTGAGMPSMPTAGSQVNVGVNLNYNAGGGSDDPASKQKAVALQRVIQANIMKTLEREKRSGGILNQPRG